MHAVRAVYGGAVADEWATRAVATPSADWWRPTRTLTTWLTAVLAVQAISQLANVFAVDNADVYVRWHDAFDALLDGRNETARRIFRDNPGQSSGWTTLAGAVAIAVLVLRILWAWRSAHNARALGRTGARLAPGWAIGAWFIPIANFVLVYILFSDLWRSSDPESERGDGWRRLPGSPLVRLWIVGYVGGFVLFFSAIGLAVGGVTGVSTTRTLLVIGGVVGAAGTVLSIFVVRDITARQEVLQARDPAPLERPIARQYAAPTAVDGPGWYADPQCALRPPLLGRQRVDRARQPRRRGHDRAAGAARLVPGPHRSVPLAVLDRQRVDRARQPRPGAVHRSVGERRHRPGVAVRTAKILGLKILGLKILGGLSDLPVAIGERGGRWRRRPPDRRTAPSASTARRRTAGLSWHASRMAGSASGSPSAPSAATAASRASASRWRARHVGEGRHRTRRARGVARALRATTPPLRPPSRRRR